VHQELERRERAAASPQASGAFPPSREHDGSDDGGGTNSSGAPNLQSGFDEGPTPTCSLFSEESDSGFNSIKPARIHEQARESLLGGFRPTCSLGVNLNLRWPGLSEQLPFLSAPASSHAQPVRRFSFLSNANASDPTTARNPLPRNPSTSYQALPVRQAPFDKPIPSSPVFRTRCREAGCTRPALHDGLHEYALTQVPSTGSPKRSLEHEEPIIVEPPVGKADVEIGDTNNGLRLWRL